MANGTTRSRMHGHGSAWQTASGLRAMLTLAALCLFPLAPAGAQPAADDNAGPESLDEAPRFPYTAVVTEEEVEARSMATRNAYPVLRLKRGDLVEVQRVFFNWYRVEAPPGVYAFIRANDVTVSEDQPGIGVVRDNRTSVMTAHISGQPGPSTQTQDLLNRGDTVDIVERVGDFYKILAVPDAKVFLPPDSLRRATEADLIRDLTADADADARETTATPAPAPAARDAADQTPDVPAFDLTQGKDVDMTRESATLDDARRDAASAPEPRASSETRAAEDTAAPRPGGTTASRSDEDPAPAPPPADEGSATETGQAVEAGAEAADPGADEPVTEEAEAGETSVVVNPPAPAQQGDAELTIPGRAETLMELDERMIPLFMMPLREQPLDRMQRTYESVLADESLDLSQADLQLISARLAAINRNRELAAMLDRIDQTRNEVAEADVRAEREAAELPADYTVMGRVMASGVYDGRRMPRLLRIVELSSGRTAAYIEPDALQAALGDKPVSAVLNQTVGITGPIRLHPGYRLRLVEPQRVDLIAAESVSPVGDAPAEPPPSGETAAP